MKHGARPILVVVAASLLLGSTLAQTAQASYPPAKNGRIAFDSQRSGNQDVWTVNADGSNPVNLTAANPTGDVAPDFSPNGQWIAFNRTDGGDADIFLMRSDGSGAVNLTPGNPTADFGAAFSPDGRRIVFNRDMDPGPDFLSDVFIMGADGSGQTNLTNSPSLDNLAGEFSPDGRRIAIHRSDGGDFDIFTISPTGGDPVNLTASSVLGEFVPGFSPSGALIAFTRDTGVDPFPSDIYFMRSDGLGGFGAIQLTSTGEDDREIGAVYSPDGSRIVFNRFSLSGPEDELWIMGSNGSGQSLLTGAEPGLDQNPSWEYIYSCAGRRATIVGSDGPDKLKGTKKRDVVVANGGKDQVRGRGGNDLICGGGGKDKLYGNNGKDRLTGGAGKDLLVGGNGKDKLKGDRKDRKRQ
jgi:Tol biopolymer transport system component